MVHYPRFQSPLSPNGAAANDRGEASADPILERLTLAIERRACSKRLIVTRSIHNSGGCSEARVVLSPAQIPIFAKALEETLRAIVQTFHL